MTLTAHSLAYGLDGCSCLTRLHIHQTLVEITLAITPANWLRYVLTLLRIGTAAFKRATSEATLFIVLTFYQRTGLYDLS